MTIFTSGLAASNVLTAVAMFVSARGTLPASAERAALQRYRMQAPNRGAFFSDLMWALLNSERFLFNY